MERNRADEKLEQIGRRNMEKGGKGDEGERVGGREEEREERREEGRRKGREEPGDEQEEDRRGSARGSRVLRRLDSLWPGELPPEPRPSGTRRPTGVLLHPIQSGVMRPDLLVSPPPAPTAPAPEYLFNKRFRKWFLFNVFTNLSVQMLFVAAAAAVLAYVRPAAQFLRTNWLLVFFFLGVFLISYVVLLCQRDYRRNCPWNILFFSAMTVGLAGVASVTAVVYSVPCVLYSFGFLVITFASIAGFAICCPCDVTVNFSFIVCLVGSLLLASAAVVLFSIFVLPEHYLNILYFSIPAVAFLIFVFYDSQQLLLGKRVLIRAEEYLYGTIQLYVDITMVFVNAMTNAPY